MTSQRTPIAATTRTRDDGTIELVAPQPGLFRATIRTGDLVHGGGVLGMLEILGHAVVLVAPAAARGAVIALRDHQLARAPVDFGAVLCTLDPRATAASAADVAIATTASAHGLVFRAPTSGRFYGRPAADKPPFVTAGTTLVAGATICLLEVMKTFHRVTYGGVNLPERARVREVLVVDGADVNANDPLLALEPEAE